MKTVSNGSNSQGSKNLSKWGKDPKYSKLKNSEYEADQVGPTDNANQNFSFYVNLIDLVLKTLKFRILD
jgi:hypothetical protein